jgi:hypothetical protein
MLHVALRLIVIPTALNDPPSVPAWMHELPVTPILEGVEPRLADGTTVTESLSLPVNGVGVVNVTSKFVDAKTATVLGEAATFVTGVTTPIVYGLLVTSAYPTPGITANAAAASTTKPATNPKRPSVVSRN